MYGPDDPWPIKCSGCLHEFTEKIGSLETAVMFRCPECGLSFHHPTEQFRLALAEARNGRLDPWRDMLRIDKPD